LQGLEAGCLFHERVFDASIFVDEFIVAALYIPAGGQHASLDLSYLCSILTSGLKPAGKRMKRKPHKHPLISISLKDQ
jgi:hypothetical protein